jgi:hypothetical protein
MDARAWSVVLMATGALFEVAGVLLVVREIRAGRARVHEYVEQVRIARRRPRSVSDIAWREFVQALHRLVIGTATGDPRIRRASVVLLVSGIIFAVAGNVVALFWA